MIVLDSWALLAFLRSEPAAERVEHGWISHGAATSSINLGEVLYLRMRERGAPTAVSDIESIRSHLDVHDPDWPLVAAAARLKAGGGLAYADCFCVATAQHFDAPLWTGDPEILGLATGVEIVDLR